MSREKKKKKKSGITIGTISISIIITNIFVCDWKCHGIAKKQVAALGSFVIFLSAEPVCDPI